MITFAADKASFAKLKASMSGSDQVMLSTDTWLATASSRADKKVQECLTTRTSPNK